MTKTKPKQLLMNTNECQISNTKPERWTDRIRFTEDKKPETLWVEHTEKAYREFLENNGDFSKNSIDNLILATRLHAAEHDSKLRAAQPPICDYETCPLQELTKEARAEGMAQGAKQAYATVEKMMLANKGYSEIIRAIREAQKQVKE